MAAVVRTGRGYSAIFTALMVVTAQAIMIVQGIGASASSLIGEWLAQTLGYGCAFYILGCFVLASVGFWVSFGREIRAASTVRELRGTLVA